MTDSNKRLSAGVLSDAEVTELAREAAKVYPMTFSAASVLSLTISHRILVEKLRAILDLLPEGYREKGVLDGMKSAMDELESWRTGGEVLGFITADPHASCVKLRSAWDELSQRLDDAQMEISSWREHGEGERNDCCEGRGPVHTLGCEAMGHLIEAARTRRSAEASGPKCTCDDFADDPCKVHTPTPERWIEDGCGNSWAKCDRPDCQLEVVRPGKVQCNRCDGTR